MSNVKGYPTNERSFNEWFRFKESEEYKEWIKDAKKLIHSKCDFITTKEEFIDLLTDLHTNRWQIRKRVQSVLWRQKNCPLLVWILQLQFFI